MPAAAIPANEIGRLESLYSYSILDTPPEQEFDELTEIAAQLCGTPVALISLIDSGRSWYKSQHGSDGPGSPRNIALCAHAILDSDLTEVPDTTSDPRFADNPLVLEDPRVRFYAGAPLATPDNHLIGTLCVIDFEPRELNDNQRSGLQTLSRLVMMQMDLRRSRLALETSEGILRGQEENLRDILENSSDLIQSVGRDGKFYFVNNAWTKTIGYHPNEIVHLNIFDIIARDYHQHCREYMGRVFAGEDPEMLETCLIGKNGNRIYVEGKVNLRSDQNVPIATRAILRDVTERRATEHLRAARALVLDRLSAAPSLSVILEDLLKHIGLFWPERLIKLSLQGDEDRTSLSLAAGNPDAASNSNGACWSESIINEKGVTIGAIATYQTTPCKASPIDRRILEECAGLAAMVIERKHTTTALEVLVENLEHIVADRTQDLRESERFTRAILQALPARIVVLDERAKILATNYEAVSPEDEAPMHNAFGTLEPGADYLQFCNTAAKGHEATGQLTVRYIDEIMNGQRTEASFEYCDSEPSQPAWYLCRLTLFPGDGPRRIIVSHEDISARKAAELNALQSQQRFEAFFEFAPDACIVADAGGEIWLANQKAEELFQYDRASLRGMAVAELLSIPQPANEDDGPGPKSEYGFELREASARRRDGSTFPAEINFSPLDFEGSEWTAASIRDMTFRQEQEQRTLRMQRLESIGTLAGGIAHDLNNALAPVLMSTAMLRGKYPNDMELVDTIETSTKRGAHMIRQLLTFARGVDGDQALIDPIRIQDEITNIIANTFPKNIRLRNICGKRAGFVLGDATQLHQVLLNLCVNARDAMPDGGELSLELTAAHLDAARASNIPHARPGDFVLWRVQDTGDGIPPQIIDRIFEPFFTTKAIDRGTGLGLSTVLGIVNSHDGFVHVLPGKPQGTIFEVYLPMEGTIAAGIDQPLPEESDFYGKAETVLIVDDEPQVRSVTSAVLQSLNFDVVSASDGQEALKIIEENPGRIRTIISDVHMPEMDGLELLQRLQSAGFGIPVILASGRFEEPDVATARGLGVLSFLDKPFTQEQLSEALEKRPGESGDRDPGPT